MSAAPLRLIAGLGNPGPEYARTRHNAGFWLIDELARRHGAVLRLEPRHSCELGRARIGAHEVWLAKPMTYMNLSGTALASLTHFYKIDPSELLVAYDELDLPPGTVRLKQGGGSAGHNGVKDIIAHLGEPFWRLRIGIGRPEAKGAGVDRVLTRPSLDEEQQIRRTIEAGADAIPLMMEQGAQVAMSRLHTEAAPAPPVP
jgi:peptidyl-tRNA hydrolase, PTH1 family